MSQTSKIAAAVSSIVSSAISNSGNGKNVSVKDPWKSDQYARSLRGRTDKYILQFPMVVSDSISEDTALLLRNQLELERANAIVMAVSNIPTLTYDPSDVNSGFLHQIHTNVNLGESVENTFPSSPLSDLHKMCLEDLTSANGKINTKVLNNYTLPKSFLNEKYELTVTSKSDRIHDDKLEQRPQVFADQDDYKLKNLREAEMDIRMIEKMNASVPIMISAQINYSVIDQNGNSNIKRYPVKFGVKVVQHLVRHEDTVFFVGESGKSSNPFTKVVEYTNGEKSLVTRLGIALKGAFGVDKAKNSVTSDKKAKNKVWQRLLALGDANKKWIQSGSLDNRILPTTTLVISTAEEEAVYKQTGFKLTSDRDFAKKLYRDLYLMEVIVVDEARKLVHRYTEGTGFEVQKFNTLEGGRLSDGQKKSGELVTLEKVLKGKLM